MSEVLYEQYKDALRRGHVAALRGRLDAAAAAYREAARIAPDRALPYVGLGGVLTRLGRADDALTAYGLALDRAPSDEGAMHGRADVLASLGRRAEAAETLDRLALILERDGRLADACDVARRALELAESRGRRQHVESLVARLRTAAPEDAAAADALERALGILDSGPGVAPKAARTAADGDGADASDGPAGVPPPPDPSLLTLAVEESLERATSTRPAGARSSRPSATGRSASSTPRWMPATRPSRSSRRTPTSTCCSPSSTSIAAGAGRRRRSWSCSGGWPSSTATRRPGHGCATWPPPASPTTRAWRRSAPDEAAA